MSLVEFKQKSSVSAVFEVVLLEQRSCRLGRLLVDARTQPFHQRSPSRTTVNDNMRNGAVLEIWLEMSCYSHGWKKFDIVGWVFIRGYLST